MANYYDSLLKPCGFEDEEIEREKPRIDKVFQRVGIGPGDMERSISWIKQNHEVQVLGVRKFLQAWLLEFLDMVLAKDEGKKVVYYGMPNIGILPQAINVDSCMDGYWDEYPNYRPERVEFLGAEINKCWDKAQEILDVKMTPESHERAIYLIVVISTAL